MKPWRMTILGLMGVVAACGVASYWLAHPTFHAASLAFTAAMTVLLVGLLEARYGRDRAFWFGFVVFGWGYALLAFAPGAWLGVRPYLFTSHLLGDLADLLGRTKLSNRIEFSWQDDLRQVVREAGLNQWFMTLDGDRFQRIGHSLAAVLHGLAGGILAGFLARRRREGEGHEIASAS